MNEPINRFELHAESLFSHVKDARTRDALKIAYFLGARRMRLLEVAETARTTEQSDEAFAAALDTLDLELEQAIYSSPGVIQSLGGIQ